MIEISSGVKMTNASFYNQLNEECAELIHASAKYIRKCNSDNPTPATWVDVTENLKEEIADVLTVISILLENEDWIEEVETIMGEKRSRWITRLGG